MYFCTMKQLCLKILLFTLAPLWAMGQTAPDNETIFEQINNPGSSCYYPNLMGRYMMGDTTITANEFRCLYYGYAYQDQYRPLEPAPADLEAAMTVLAANPEPDFEGALKLIKACEKALPSDPFNLQLLNVLMYAYNTAGVKSGEATNYFRFRNVINAINGSGDGLTEKTPYHILSFNAASDLLTSKGLTPGKPMLISRSTDFIPVVEKREGVKGYYFDFSRIYWKKPENFEKQRSGGWEFNGVKMK